MTLSPCGGGITPSPFVPLPGGKGEEKERGAAAPLKRPFYLSIFPAKSYNEQKG